MCEQLKNALMESYVGAIAIGLLLSEGISGIVRAVVNPITLWLLQLRNPANFPMSSNAAALRFESVLPQLLIAVFVLLIAYALLRWLYFPPAESQDQTPEPEQDA